MATNSNSFATSQVRTGGSGFTIFTFQGHPIAFAQQVAHVSAKPVAPATPIHPMDEPYPIQIITPAAGSMGTITLNLYEVYYSKVWDRLGAGSRSAVQGDASSSGGLLNGAVDIVDIFIKIAREKPEDVNMVKLIRPPALAGSGSAPSSYWEVYHKCVITDVVDGESIQVGTMEVIKQITVAYTHTTRNGAKSSAWDLRDRSISAPKN